jgi:hypothetical protein
MKLLKPSDETMARTHAEKSESEVFSNFAKKRGGDRSAATWGFPGVMCLSMVPPFGSHPTLCMMNWLVNFFHVRQQPPAHRTIARAASRAVPSYVTPAWRVEGQFGASALM